MKALPMREIFRPTIIALQILGINFGKYENGKRSFSKISFILTFLYLTLVAVFTVTYWKNRKYEPNFLLSKVVMLVLVNRGFGTLFVMVVLLVSAYSKTFVKLTILSRQIDQLDLDLAKFGFGLEEKIAKMSYQHRKFLTSSLLVTHLLFNACGDFSTAWIIPQDKINYFFVLMYPRLVVTTIHITFLTYTKILEERFKMVNEVVARNGQNFDHNIQRAVNCHRILTKQSQNLNSIFNFQLLLTVILSFILILVDLHALLFLIFLKIFSPSAVVSLKNSVMYAVDIVYLIKRCSSLCFEVYKCGKIGGYCSVSVTILCYRQIGLKRYF